LQVTIENKFGSDTAPATLMVTDKEEDVQDWKAQLKKTYDINNNNNNKQICIAP